jgi:hypothetical protein
MAKIPLELPNGQRITLSPGGQNVLVAEIVNEFCPRFVPGGQPVYVGDTESKHAFFDSQLLDQLGIKLAPRCFVWMILSPAEVSGLRLSLRGCQREAKGPGTGPSPSGCIAAGSALGSHACVALSSDPARI